MTGAPPADPVATVRLTCPTCPGGRCQGGGQCQGSHLRLRAVQVAHAEAQPAIGCLDDAIACLADSIGRLYSWIAANLETLSAADIARLMGVLGQNLSRLARLYREKAKLDNNATGHLVAEINEALQFAGERLGADLEP